MMGAVSPAVVVPSCIELQKKGYGTDKGIPSVIIAASSLDDVLAISLFGLLVGISFGSSEEGLFGDPLLDALLVGPVEICGGLLIGIALGYVSKALIKLPDIWKSILLFIVCWCLVLASHFIGLSGLGFLASITVSSVAGTQWGPESV